MENLYKQIKNIVSPSICDEKIAKYWLDRLEKGDFTRDDGNPSHFCCYFLPYNIEAKEVFVVHHKKSGLWIFPGGHIDKDEDLMQTLNREIEEELGIKNKIQEEIKPFLLTITPIENRIQPCKEHLDIWYRFHADTSEFSIDPREFHDTKWLSVEDARKLITDPPNLEALTKMEELFKSL